MAGGMTEYTGTFEIPGVSQLPRMIYFEFSGAKYVSVFVKPLGGGSSNFYFNANNMYAWVCNCAIENGKLVVTFNQRCGNEACKIKYYVFPEL